MNGGQIISLKLIRAYQLVLSPLQSSLFGPMAGCRFTPNCSKYAADAIAEHGVLIGAKLAAARVCRCHPWGSAGFDPVPRRNT